MDNLVKVRLTTPQIRLIENIVAIPDDIEESITKAAKNADGPMREIPYAILDQLAGWLAAEANYEENSRRRRSLDLIYDEVQTALWEFDDRKIARGEPIPFALCEAITQSKPAKATRSAKAACAAKAAGAAGGAKPALSTGETRSSKKGKAKSEKKPAKKTPAKEPAKKAPARKAPAKKKPAKKKQAKKTPAKKTPAKKKPAKKQPAKKR